MAPNKDSRRVDLVIPYQEPKAKSDTTDFSSTMATTLPMAAMFTRNKFIGWAAVVFSIQSWLGESEDAKRNSTTPGYFSVGMSIMSLAITYLPMFLPPVAGKVAAPAQPAILT